MWIRQQGCGGTEICLLGSVLSCALGFLLNCLHPGEQNGHGSHSGWGLEQCSLVEGVPAHERDLKQVEL